MQRLGLALVPYCLLVVVPLMGRMSDAQPVARALAARTFAAVVAVMPLSQVDWGGVGRLARAVRAAGASGCRVVDGQTLPPRLFCGGLC